MDKRGRQILLFSAFLLAISIMTLYFVFAGMFIVSIVTPQGAINGTGQVILNVSVTNLEFFPLLTTENITHVNISINNSFIIYPLTNGSSVLAPGLNSLANFSTTTNGSLIVLEWKNATDGLIANQTAPPTIDGQRRFFWINISGTVTGLYNVTVDARFSDNSYNQSIYTISVNDVDPPREVNSSGPPNNATYNESTVFNFTCSASDDFEIRDIRLVLRNNDGPWIFNDTPGYGNISGTYNQINYTQLVMFPGAYEWYCEALDGQNSRNESTHTNLTVNAFSISGWVKNSTFANVSGANVSIYEQIMQQNGPPILRIINSTTTGLNGNFILLNVRNNRSYQQGICEGQCDTIYRIQVTLNNTAGFVTQVGPTLPPMPREPLVFSMNGGTFYLQTAATLQLYANNGTSSSNSLKQLFGYEVIDTALGFPIQSSIQSNVSIVNISVPSGRGYTVMFARSPDAFGEIEACWNNPGFMNDSNCPSPPISVTINSSCLEASALGAPVAGCNTTEIYFSSYLITINKSLVYNPANLTGCLNIVGNSSEVKLTNIMSKMIPWEGFIPPMDAGIMDFNVSDDDSYITGKSDKGCTLGRYNLSLIGAATGVQFMIEAYANGTDEYFAAFKNITINITSSGSTNFTLVKLLGQYSTGEVNTSRVEVAITDENGTVSEDLHVEVYVRNNESQVFHYIIQDLNNGRFNFSLLNNTKEARVRVFQQSICS